MFLAVYSAFVGKPVPHTIALTGEISIHGNVLPVGGVEEKLQAAEEAGVTSVFLPKDNWKKSYDKGKMQVIPVEKVQEILERVFLPESLAEGMELLKEKGIS